MSDSVTGVNTQATVEKKPQSQPQTTQPQPATPVQQSLIQPQTPKPAQQSNDLSKYAGLDIGTMNIISSRPKGNTVETKRIRNVFIDLTLDQVKMLKLSGETSYITKGENCYVLGDDAANIANIFCRQLRTPMKKGVLSAGEIEAMEMLKIMVGEVLGKAPQGGICVVSSPGDPIDNDFDALYHQAIVTDIVSSYGWKVETSSESTAMAYSECADNLFTGLCISFGHGMTNVSLVFKTIEALKFSIARGGSWIDDQASKVTGKTSSQICALKEKGIDLINPVGRDQQAIVVYYKHLIKYAISNFISKFKGLQSNLELPNAIPVVIAGGTSLAKGFTDLVKQSINEAKGFPFEVSTIKQASDPLNTISRGLLVMAQNKS